MADKLQEDIKCVRDAWTDYRREKNNGGDLAALVVCDSPEEEAAGELTHALRPFRTRWKETDLPEGLRQELREAGFLSAPLETLIQNLQTALGAYKSSADNASMAVFPWTQEKRTQRGDKAEVAKCLKLVERIGGLPALPESLRTELAEEGFIKSGLAAGRH